MKILDIQTTPNPCAIKFIVDKHLTPPSEILTSDNSNHTLIKSIYEFNFVESIMIQGTWITIRFKEEHQVGDTDILKTIAEVIRPYDKQESNPEKLTPEKTFQSPMALMIKEVLKDEILPYLNSHGGSVELMEVQGTQVFLKYIGACGGCPVSTTATLRGIERVLKKEVDPEIEVILV